MLVPTYQIKLELRNFLKQGKGLLLGAEHLQGHCSIDPSRFAAEHLPIAKSIQSQSE